MDKTAPQSVDAYLAAQPPPARRVLARVRATLRKALPGASERISYRIPELELAGRMVLYFAGFPRHYAIYPATAGVVAALGDELAGLLHGRATLRFSYDDAVPTRLITRIAKLRAAEAAGEAIARPARRVGVKKKAKGAGARKAPATRTKAVKRATHRR